MLRDLTLWNVGGIRRAELSFGPGLTVITGESGAGKSSVVRALELVAGKRGAGQLLRAGEEEGGAEARFLISEEHLPLFRELDDALQPDDDGELLVRRVLRENRSRVSLQGVQIPLATYALAAGRLIHIQSQFAQMELLDEGRQLAMVDSCTAAPVQETAAELRRIFERAQASDRELRAMTNRRSEVERRYTNANEVLSLVRHVAPEAGLESRLEGELSALSRRIARREKAQINLDRLDGGLSEQGLLSHVRGAFDSLLDILPDEQRQDIQRTIDESLRALEEAAETAREAAMSSDEDNQERDRVETHLGALRRLRRLSGTADEEGLLAWCRDAQESLEWLEKSYPQLEELSRESRELRRQASALAMELRRGRREAAVALEHRVNALLEDLAMGGNTFEVHFRELDKLRRGGADEVEFNLCSGQRTGRVDKVASGGELSRLLLALQLSLSDEWLPPTLVFDEVEAGLGGRAAVLAGRKLKELSRRCQVLLVTHEASIAALGDAHILIQRSSQGEFLSSGDISASGGESQVRPIEGEERVREIARMLSGSPDLEEAQEHARTLLGA
ncbi:MAG: AAA family ATPase [Fretibacterium sp.]|nr:AAA family ATPase [Fretibacterium sp.]